MEHILALDLGTSHVGVAVNSNQIGISSLNEITFEDQFQLADKILSLIEEYTITTIVVGDMGEKRLSPFFETVIKRVQSQASVVVIIIPEKLSTKQAEQKSGSHSQAAAEILTDYTVTSKR